MTALETALAYADAQFPVFPCKRTDKRPLTRNGFKDATSDPEKIREWWTRWPDAMIGLPTGRKSGLFVVDLDVDKMSGEEIGKATVESLGLADALKTGVRARTPSGGTHIYFAGNDELKSTAGALGVKVDTRGAGGYVIAPGSINGVGSYEWSGPSILDHEPPRLPAEIASRLGKRKTDGDALQFVKQKHGASVAELRALLATLDPDMPPASFEGGPRDWWSRVGMALHHETGGSIIGAGLFEEWSTKHGDWNRPKDAQERETAWRSFSTIRFGETATFATIKHFATPTDDPAEFVARPFTLSDPASLPRRDWLYGRHLIRKFVSMTVAPGGIGKSSLVVAEAMAMAAGRELLGETVKAPLRVWYWNLEDPQDELQRRFAATALHHGITAADIGDRLFLNSGRDDELCIATSDRNGAHVLEPVVDRLVGELVERKIDVLIVDPFVSSHRVPENDNGAIDAVAKAWARVADRADCAVELVHHSRKMNGEGVDAAESSRGAVALVGAVRDARSLNRMTADEASRAGIADDLRSTIFRVKADKANLAPVTAARWLRTIGVTLGNGSGFEDGDTVGVVVEWTWPEARDGLTDEDVAKVCAAISDGEWRKSDQSPAWAGHAVAAALEWDLSDPHTKRRIKRLIEEWIGSGVLLVETRLDAKRMQRDFIVVGKSIEGEEW